MFDLVEYRIGFGIGFDRHNNKLDAGFIAVAMANIRHRAAVQFGGYTLHLGSGGWNNPDGELIQEAGYTLTILAGGELASDDTIAAFARWVGHEVNQHSIVVTCGNRSAILPVD